VVHSDRVLAADRALSVSRDVSPLVVPAPTVTTEQTHAHISTPALSPKVSAITHACRLVGW